MTQPINHPILNEPYVITPEDIAQRKLELLELKDDEVLLDLGCGDAQVLIRACSMAQVTCIGYEVLPEVLALAKKNVATAELKDRIEIRPIDFRKADLSKTDAVIIYATRTSLGALSLKLELELPKGARIVTHQFDLPGWTAEKEVEVLQRNGLIEKIYCYRQQ